MTEAFSNINRVFGARPMPERPGWLRGWLKLPPSISDRDGHLVCVAEYSYGEWPEYLYEPCPSNT